MGYMLLFPSLPVAARICWPVDSLMKHPSTPAMAHKICYKQSMVHHIYVIYNTVFVITYEWSTSIQKSFLASIQTDEQAMEPWIFAWMLLQELSSDNAPTTWIGV